jgi:hypothetical protein
VAGTAAGGGGDAGACDATGALRVYSNHTTNETGRERVDIRSSGAVGRIIYQHTDGAACWISSRMPRRFGLRDLASPCPPGEASGPRLIDFPQPISRGLFGPEPIRCSARIECWWGLSMDPRY